MNRESGIEQDTKLSWSTIKVRGDEAESFLQGQLSQDVATIGEQGAWALLLAPDSAVIAACYVRAHGGGYDVEVPRALVEAALTRLRRFLLRTRATLEVEPSDGGPFATLDEQIDASWPGVAEFAAGLAPTPSDEPSSRRRSPLTRAASPAKSSWRASTHAVRACRGD